VHRPWSPCADGNEACRVRWPSRQQRPAEEAPQPSLLSGAVYLYFLEAYSIRFAGLRSDQGHNINRHDEVGDRMHRVSHNKMNG
jgi:hypothetical protein